MVGGGGARGGDGVGVGESRPAERGAEPASVATSVARDQGRGLVVPFRVAVSAAGGGVCDRICLESDSVAQALARAILHLCVHAWGAHVHLQIYVTGVPLRQV